MCNLPENHPSVGILTYCPSATPFGFSLGPTNPWLNTIAKETLDFQWSGLSPDLRLLRPTFSLLCAPASVPLRLHCSIERFPTTSCLRQDIHVFGMTLSPGNLWRVLPLRPVNETVWTVSCYTLFKR